MTSKVAARPERKSFSRLDHVLDVPNLIDIQKASFSWFMEEGLRETIEDISPIEDYTGTLAVEFGSYAFKQPQFSIKECREKDLTYEVPLEMVVRFVNKDTGEIREQTVFMGNFPRMTDQGTFIINGTERVIVTQLVRSPGAYLMEPKDATKQVFTANLMPSRGSWLELEIDKKGAVYARIDRKRKLPITTLLRALPTDDRFRETFKETLKGVADDRMLHYQVDASTNEKILELFDNSPYLVNTLEKDPSTREEEAVIEVFKKQRPGEPPTLENARNLLRGLFFDAKRYDLTKVGRYKLNQRLEVDVPEDVRVLTPLDILALTRRLVDMPAKLGVPEDSKDFAADAIGLPRAPIAKELDEYEHFGNRRLRTVGELIQEAFRVGLYRMERVVRERMTTEDVDTITPQTIINVRPVQAALKEFFGSSQLSQFMDQTNSLAGLTHRRRLSALGAGGLTRERAPIEVRDVHPTHYGRMCPIETPEGPNIGLIGSPRLVRDGLRVRVRPDAVPGRQERQGDRRDHLPRRVRGGEVHRRPGERADRRQDRQVRPRPRSLPGRRAATCVSVAPKDIHYMDVNPAQIVSVATALIPFLEHNDANRALMGSNMQRQAVPLLIAEPPLVGTGLEYRAAVDTGDVVIASRGGTVVDADAEKIVVEAKGGERDDYELVKFMRSNQGTLIHQKAVVNLGSKVEEGQVLADGSSTKNGELALGKNLLVAFMPFEGFNFEDAIVVSERLVKDDLLSSIHIHEYEIDARSTKLGDEEITRDIPNRSEESLRDLDDRGIVRIGAEVGSGDLLVGKVTPKGETELTAEEKLIRAIFKEKAREVRDTSLKVPHGEGGKVIAVKTFSRDGGDDLPPGVNELVRVYVAKKRKVAEGDKLAGRHGNKGVIAKIVPEEDMPFLEDGTPVDVVLNPLGVPSRMNIGQVLETHLGWAAHHGVFGNGDGNGETPVATPVFDGATPEQVDEALVEWARQNGDSPITLLVDESRPAGRWTSGKVRLLDGRTGEPFDQKVTVGYMYILKLLHLVDDKIHARSTGPYSLVTQQPLGGKAQFGGQRFGEMEVWALEAYGAAYTLQEMLTIKSDDTVGRVKAYEAIVKGENIAEPSIPESFKVLLKEMQSLALDVQVLSEEGGEVEVREEEDELLRAAEELGIDLSPGSLRAAARPPTAEEVEEGQDRVDEDGELALPADEELGDLTEIEADGDVVAEAADDGLEVGEPADFADVEVEE